MVERIHIREKLTGGGDKKFFPDKITSAVQGNGVVTIITGGQSFTVKDEQLVGPAGPAGVIARINEAKARLPKTRAESLPPTVPTLEQRVSKLETRITTLEQR